MSVFFFFKQKTAYEMRISAWSSDVCSSDLCVTGPGKLSGAIAVDDGKPSLRGPITLARVACAQSGFSLESASVQLALEVGRDLSSLTGKGDRKSTRMNSSH